MIVKILSNSGTKNQICTHNNLKQYYKFGENSLNYLNSYSKHQCCKARTKDYLCAKILGCIDHLHIQYVSDHVPSMCNGQTKLNTFSVLTLTPIFYSKEIR